MKIKYHGHSCFSVTSNDYTIVLDPYCGIEGFNDINLQANEVITSHSHRDHAYIEGVKITDGNSTFKVTKLDSYHDDCNGNKRGLNIITVLEAENRKIVHLGDLGHFLDKQTIDKIYNCDILMIPVGGFYTIGINEAIQIIEDVKPSKVIPMHYKDNKKGLDVLSSIDDFMNTYNKPCELVKGYEQEIEI